MFENVIATTAVLTLMLGGVIGAMDNVQSFIGFFMASLSHVVESWKSTNTLNLWLGMPELLPETGISTNEKPRNFLLTN